MLSIAPVGNGREMSLALLCLHLWELGGVSGAIGWCWVCTCGESSMCNCTSVWIILASEGGAKCSFFWVTHVAMLTALAICECGCSSWHEQSQFSSMACAPASSRQAFLQLSHCTCWAMLWGSTSREAGAREPGSHGARDYLCGSPIWWGPEVQPGKRTLGCTVGVFQGAGWSWNLNFHQCNGNTGLPPSQVAVKYNHSEISLSWVTSLLKLSFLERINCTCQEEVWKGFELKRLCFGNVLQGKKLSQRKMCWAPIMPWPDRQVQLFCPLDN